MSAPKNSRSDIGRYSGAGIQMVLIMGVFIYIGRRLDAHYMPEKPWWTLGLAIFGVIISMVFMVKSFSKISDNNKNKKK